jgi:hypothetical protein
MKADHEYAAHAIRNLLARCSDHPMVESSGPWGAFACTAEAIAIAIGDRSTLETLKLGEEHGCDLYRTALEEPQLSAEARQLIRTRLLPRCYRHRQALETMLTA